jgi:hypothetical protein
LEDDYSYSTRRYCSVYREYYYDKFFSCSKINLGGPIGGAVGGAIALIIIIIIIVCIWKKKQASAGEIHSVHHE